MQAHVCEDFKPTPLACAMWWKCCVIKTCQRLADFVHRVFHSKGGNVHKIVTSSMVEAFLNRDDCSYPHQMKSEKLEMI
jgi:hypothetical protein